MAVEYEFVFLTPLGLDKDSLKETFSELEKQVKSINGKVVNKEDWGSKELAYEIKGNDQANFWIWQLGFPEDTKFASLNTFLNRSSNIIRYLLLKSPIKKGKE